MNILITGSNGMVGKALVRNLKNIRDGKNKTRPRLKIEQIYEYDINSNYEDLKRYCYNSDFIFNLAGVNRTKNKSEYMNGNCEFTSKLLDILKQVGNKCPIMLASSIQATLEGRFENSMYGISKKEGEDLLLAYGEETGAKVLVYRFPNLMGHSKPNYNSAISTFCHAVANDLPYTVSDRNVQLEVLYIDDLIEAMFDALEGKEHHCEYNGTVPVERKEGRYCYVPRTHQVTLGEIVDLLENFKNHTTTLIMPVMAEGSFEKKLFSLYLTYLPIDKFKYNLETKTDERGAFTEIIRTLNCGQLSVNVIKPGVTKGQHWHNSKWEIFIVVSGYARICERNIYTGESSEFYVSGKKLEAIHMVPGWTHNISNLSENEDLVTVIWANESFDPNFPDTFSEIV